MLRMHRVGLLAAISLLLAACASLPPPIAEVDAAERAVLQAERAGARGPAGQSLAAARSQLQAANAALTAKRYPEALAAAQRAEADADLAHAHARLAAAREAADSRAARNAELRSELLIRGGN